MMIQTLPLFFLRACIVEWDAPRKESPPKGRAYFGEHADSYNESEVEV